MAPSSSGREPVQDIDIAALFRTIGELEQAAKERKEQTTQLFALLRELRDNMPTRDDFRQLSEKFGRHVRGEDCGIGALRERLGAQGERIAQLEQDRKWVKGAAAAAGAALLAAIGAVINGMWK